MEQNSFDWLKWRQGRLGSSDIPAIMGTCKYRTRLDVYESKFGTPEDKTSYIMEEGKREEAKVRAAFELRTGHEYPPQTVESAEYPFLGASVDGWNPSLKEGLEAKLVGEKVFIEAQLGQIPLNYMDQVQYQMAICGSKRWHYVCSNKKEHCHIIVTPNEARQKEIIETAIKFWNENVLKKKPPEYSDKDFKPLKGVEAKIEEWKTLKRIKEECETKLGEIEDFIKPLVIDKRMVCNGVKLIRMSRQGNVDYSKIPELKGVDLDSYRKQGSEFVTMRME